MKDYQLDGNKEMVALGAMNVVGSMTSCYVATGKLHTSFYEIFEFCVSRDMKIFFRIDLLFSAYNISLFNDTFRFFL